MGSILSFDQDLDSPGWTPGNQKERKPRIISSASSYKKDNRNIFAEEDLLSFMAYS